jgi:hypothetical protein
MAHVDTRIGEVKGKLANAVGSQYPSHYLGTRCIQHYYRWWHTPRLPAVDWTDAPPPGRFKWTRPFRAKDEIWILRMCHHISTGLYLFAAVTVCCNVSTQIRKLHCAMFIQRNLLRIVTNIYGRHSCWTPVEMWWLTVTHGRGSEGETGECSG